MEQCPGRTTAERVHGTLISMGLIQYRPGVGTFVLKPPAKGKRGGRAVAELQASPVMKVFLTISK